MNTDNVAYWLEIAEYDLGTAEDLFRSKRWLFVALMRTMNIEARYPDYKKHLAQSLNEVACQDMINQTKLMLQWIKEQLSQANKPLNLSADTNKQ